MKRIRLNDEQCMLRDNAKLFLADITATYPGLTSSSPERASVESSWNQMADLGWPAILVPEKYGGLDFGFLSMSLLLEEMGAVCFSNPFFSTAVTGALVLNEFASDEHKSHLLPLLASGSLTVTFAIQEGDSEFDFSAVTLVAKQSADGYCLSGTKDMVPDAAGAQYLIALALAAGEDHKFDLFLVPADSENLMLTPLQTMYSNTDCKVEFQGVCLPHTAKLNTASATIESIVRVLSIVGVAKSAEMVGGAKSAMALAVDHAKERRQFGSPIGSFQAIQHHCVNMLMQVESARRITYRAASAIDDGNFNVGEIVRAKAWTNQAYREVVRLAHQVLGGVGYCEDHAMPRYFRHARQAEATFGDTDTLQDIVAAGLLD